MPIYKGTTELTKIADFLTAAAGHDIQYVYFGDKQVFTVWGEYDGTLPATYSANGDYLGDYRIYGAVGGVGDVTAQLFDPNATDTNNGYIAGKYLGYNNEILNPTTPNEWAISEYIPCSPNLAYVLKTIGNNTYQSICWYDDNYNFLSGTQYNLSAILTVTSPANAAYVRFSIYRLDMSQNSLTLSPAPESHVPYGYEVDMSVGSANLYDITTQIPISVNSNKSEYIRVEASTAYTLWHNATDNIQRNLQLCDSNKTVIAEILVTRGTKSFTFNTNNSTAYVVIIYPARSTQVMLTKGSTVPLTYIPYSSTTIPIYIGDEPLGEDEYVDFGEQKIYKRGRNLFNENNVTFGKWLEADGTIGTRDISCISGKILIASEKNYNFYCTNLTSDVFNLRIFEYDKNDSITQIVDTDVQESRSYTSSTNAAYVIIGIANTSHIMTKTMLQSFKVVFCEGERLSEYIPYQIVPQDPPVSLPALPTVDGVTITDYAGQSAAVPSRFVAKFRKEGY